jgi:predicted transcriptional regulator
MTTITIDDETKEELLKIAAELQIQKRKKINYNATIKFLIKNYFRKNNKKDKIKFREACEKVDNIDVNSVLEELYLERKKDEISF